MNERLLTLKLPPSLYQRYSDRAARTQRSVETEILELLVAAIELEDRESAEIDNLLSAMNELDDETLRREAEKQFDPAVADKLEALNWKKQSEGLDERETQTLTALLREYDMHMLTRAQAAVLLQRRGLPLPELQLP